MRLIIPFALLFIASLFMDSCNKGPTGGVPFYMKMDTAMVTLRNNMSVSSNTQGIQDVWVEESATNIGAYELPCLFPVLDKDSVHFVVSPGVWQSSQHTNPVIYPFLNADVFTIFAVLGNKYTHVPTFTYKTDAQFQFNEDFETGMDYNTNMVKTPDSAKYGYRCGKITLSSNDSSVVACQQSASNGSSSSSCPYTLTAGQEIWVELDYKSDVPFWSGIIAHFNISGATDTIQVLFLLPTNTWTKEYIKLSETIGNEGANTYNLYFQALKPYGSAGGSVYLDNIRLVHM